MHYLNVEQIKQAHEEKARDERLPEPLPRTDFMKSAIPLNVPKLSNGLNNKSPIQAGPPVVEQKIEEYKIDNSPNIFDQLDYKKNHTKLNQHSIPPPQTQIRNPISNPVPIKSPLEANLRKSNPPNPIFPPTIQPPPVTQNQVRFLLVFNHV